MDSNLLASSCKHSWSASLVHALFPITLTWRLVLFPMNLLMELSLRNWENPATESFLVPKHHIEPCLRLLKTKILEFTHHPYYTGRSVIFILFRQCSGPLAISSRVKDPWTSRQFKGPASSYSEDSVSSYPEAYHPTQKLLRRSTQIFILSALWWNRVCCNKLIGWLPRWVTYQSAHTSADNTMSRQQRCFEHHCGVFQMTLFLLPAVEVSTVICTDPAP